MLGLGLSAQTLKRYAPCVAKRDPVAHAWSLPPLVRHSMKRATTGLKVGLVNETGKGADASRPTGRARRPPTPTPTRAVSMSKIAGLGVARVRGGARV
jgi:hypothetical protein